MHMADALISPTVGATMWAATAATTAYCAKKVKEEADPARVPLMGVTGAFVFSAQMLNFTIPATGSSGHLGGGLVLAALLGPHAAFLVIASVLTVQALFFADGGLLALGANIFNLGVFPAFIAYPFVFRRIVGDSPGAGRFVAGSVAGAVVGLSLGALGVVLETVASGISSLPFGTFVALMMPIHFAIGLVEGLVTAAVVMFVHNAQPEILARAGTGRPVSGVSMKTVLMGFAVAAVIAGGAVSWFASTHPDGLEWSIEGITGSPELEAGEAGIFGWAANIQAATAFLPDYAFEAAGENAEQGAEESPSWPAVDAGTSVAGIVGGVITLFMAAAIGYVLNRRSARRDREAGTTGAS